MIPTAPEHTRPFNIEHARAGAPFCCANGEAVDILKWDRKHTLCIIGLARQDAAVRMWREDGSYSDTNSKAYPLVMTPLGFVDGKPVFVGDDLVSEIGGEFTAQAKSRGFVGCVWPAPAPVYPETRLDGGDLHAIYLQQQDPSCYAGFTAIANAAIRHAIDVGQVVLPYPGTLNHDEKRLYGSVADVEHFAELMRQLDPRAPTKDDYDRVSRQLGKAERLLESLGWRSDGNGDWESPGILDGLIKGAAFSVNGSNKSIAMVRDLVDGRDARDMAIAEAVRNCARNNFCEDGNPAIKVKTAYARISNMNLPGIIAGVKPC